MAEIYSYEEGYVIAVGLQGSDVCDDAIDTARRIAADRDERVELHDDDGVWIVSPDGSCDLVGPPEDEPPTEMP